VGTFALIHGGGGSAWDWHLVEPALHERGHDPIAVDLPSEDETAGWWECVDTVVRAIRDDRMFPAGWARRHARARLGSEADEMDGGHYVTLSRPRELADRLDAYATGQIMMRT